MHVFGRTAITAMLIIVAGVGLAAAPGRPATHGAPATKVYTNARDGYSFRYPATWALATHASLAHTVAFQQRGGRPMAVAEAPDGHGALSALVASGHFSKQALWNLEGSILAARGTEIPVGLRQGVLRVNGVSFAYTAGRLMGTTPEHLFVEAWVYAVPRRATALVFTGAADLAWLQDWAEVETSLQSIRVRPSGGPGLGAPDAPVAPAPLSFSQNIEPFFTAHCGACHAGAGLTGVELGTYAGLFARGHAVPGPLVVPGHHARSILWQVLQPQPPYPGGNRMPLGGPFLPTYEISMIAEWIDQGARR